MPFKAAGKLGTIGCLIVLIAVGVAAALLNPSEEKHKEIVYAEVKEELKGEDESAGVGGLVLDVAKRFDVIKFEYKDYVVYSKLMRKDRTVSIGAFGLVHVVKEEEKE